MTYSKLNSLKASFFIQIAAFLFDIESEGDF